MRKRTRGTVAHWFAIVVLLVFGLAMAMLAILDPGDGSHRLLLLSALTFAFAFAVFYAMKRNQWVSRVQQTLFGVPTEQQPSRSHRAERSQGAAPEPASGKAASHRTAPASPACRIKIVEVETLLDGSSLVERPMSLREYIAGYVLAMAVMGAIALLISLGWRGLLVAGGLFAAWGIFDTLKLKPRGTPADPLILRVFGHGEVAKTLAEIWRNNEGAATWLAGPRWMDLNIAPGTVFSAANAADPFAAMAAGGCAILDTDQLRKALQQRKIAFFKEYVLVCGHDVWRDAVTALVSQVDYIVFDLSGHHLDATGCRFELELLMSQVPAERMLFIIDAATEWATVESALRQTSAGARGLEGPITVLRDHGAAEHRQDLARALKNPSLFKFQQNLLRLLRRADAEPQMPRAAARQQRS
jgi:hypothetical protein